MALSLPALQNPSLMDWQISPGSFAATPQTLVGADGCETLMPANLVAVETFPLRQIQRLIGTTGLQKISPEFPIALIVEYMVEVTPIGHSLGQILYTLPLAPGESVRLAVLDWRRTDTGTRTEATKFDEGLIHDQARDRTITEVLNGAIDEWQRGGSVMGGVSGGAGASASTGAMGASGGAMASVGGAYTTSSGTRDISVSTMQRVADAIHQASNAERELTSTVVVNTDQKERENVETRSFTNHNRGHTLTILYYEVLRHFHVKVTLNRVYEGLLIDRGKFSWRDTSILRPPTGDPPPPPPDSRPLPWSFNNNSFILAKRYILQPALLDSTLTPAAFDALVRLQAKIRELSLLRKPPKAPTWEGDEEFVRINVNLGIATNNSNNSIFVAIKFVDGTMRQVRFSLDGTGPGVANINDSALGNDFNKDNGRLRIRSPEISPAPKWKDMTDIIFICADGEDKTEWGSIEIIGIGKNIGPKFLVGPARAGDQNWVLHEPPDEQPYPIVRPAAPPPQPPPPDDPRQKISPEDYNLTEMLKDHLSMEQEYYNRLLELAIQPQAYAADFEKMPVGTTPGVNLLDFASPTPLELFGTKVAFPRLISDASNSNKEIIKRLYQPQADPQQRLITLPTRGLFAEAKLGHCNVAEEIDDTRFWKWEEHPLPETAPEIAPVQIVTPENNPPNTTPTPFPTPIVNIQQPPAAPDPTGAAAMLRALTTPDVFRNMSGAQQVQDMLKSLTEGAVAMAQAASKNLQSAQKTGVEDSESQRSHDAAMAKIASDDRRAELAQTTPEKVQQVEKLTGRLVDEGRITPSKRDEIMKHQVENLKGSSAPVPPPQPKDPLRERKILFSVHGESGISMHGRYQAELWHSGQKLARQEATESIEGTFEFVFKPVDTKPSVLIRDFLAEMISPNAGLKVASVFDVAVPADLWDKYEFYHCWLDLTTQPKVIKTTSTKTTIEKLAVELGIGGSLEESAAAALAKIVNIVIKDVLTGNVVLKWTPFDETKTFAEEKNMTVNFYDGGIKVVRVS